MNNLRVSKRYWVCKVNLISWILKLILKAESIVVSLSFLFLWRLDLILVSLFLFFTFIIRVTFIVKIFSDFSLKVIPEVPDVISLCFPSLLAIVFSFVSHFTHDHDLHSSWIKHSWFCEVDDIKSYFLISLHIRDREVKPLWMSSCIRINSHLKIILIWILSFSKLKIATFKIWIKNQILVRSHLFLWISIFMFNSFLSL